MALTVSMEYSPLFVPDTGLFWSPITLITLFPSLLQISYHFIVSPSNISHFHYFSYYSIRMTLLSWSLNPWSLLRPRFKFLDNLSESGTQNIPNKIQDPSVFPLNHQYSYLFYNFGGIKISSSMTRVNFLPWPTLGHLQNAVYYTSIFSSESGISHSHCLTWVPFSFLLQLQQLFFLFFPFHESYSTR